MSEAKLSQRIERTRAATAIAIVAGGLLLSGCSKEASQEDQENRLTSPPSEFTLSVDAEFRTDPSYPDSDEDDSTCYKIGQEHGRVYISGLPYLYPAEDNPDGTDWVGFLVHSFGEDIQEACGQDPDGVIWVSGEHIENPLNYTE